MSKNKKLKAYFFHDVNNDQEGYLIIAKTAREALKYGRSNTDLWLDVDNFTDLRAKLMKHIDCSGLKEGLHDPQTEDEWFDSIKRGLNDDYPDDFELTCPVCKQKGILATYVGEGNKETVMCEKCSEKEE